MRNLKRCRAGMRRRRSIAEIATRFWRCSHPTRPCLSKAGREPGTLIGHDEIQRIIGIVARWPRTAHLIAQGLYVVEGESALGEIYCTANHFRGGEPDGQNHVMHIRYLDKYSLDGGRRWRIAHRRVVVDATEDRAASIGGLS